MAITEKDILEILDNCYDYENMYMEWQLNHKIATRNILNLIERAQYDVIQNLGKEIFQKVLGLFELNLTKEEIKQNIENLAEVYVGERE